MNNKPKIIAFTGLMGTGKSSAVSLLQKILIGKGKATLPKKFAQPLYDIQKYIYHRSGLECNQEKDRELLQFLGTEWGRKKDEDIWVNIFKNEIYLNSSIEFILNDDLRFDNEAAAVKELNGIIVKVIGPQRIETINTNHSSEKGISDKFVDFILDNSVEGSAELEKQLDSLLFELGV